MPLTPELHYLAEKHCPIHNLNSVFNRASRTLEPAQIPRLG